eukprot:751175-Hanusia_phi.AAC.2
MLVEEETAMYLGFVEVIACSETEVFNMEDETSSEDEWQEYTHVAETGSSWLLPCLSHFSSSSSLLTSAADKEEQTERTTDVKAQVLKSESPSLPPSLHPSIHPSLHPSLPLLEF